MNKTNYTVPMSKCSYCSPTCEALEIWTEGVLCLSSTADSIIQGNPLVEDDDFEQIF